MLKFSWGGCVHCPEERQDPPGSGEASIKEKLMVRQKLALRTGGIVVCVTTTPGCGRSKSCLGCPCRGWCQQSFAFSHNIVLCAPHSESLMVSENGTLPSMEVLTASFSSGCYLYSTYFYGTYRSLKFLQGLLFCFSLQKIKLIGLSLEHAEVLMVLESWGGM